MMTYYKISQLAARTGLSPARLRLWEKEYGVITPARSTGGFRLYDEPALATLLAMKRLVDEGMTPRAAARRLRKGNDPAVEPGLEVIPAAPTIPASNSGLINRLETINIKLDQLLQASAGSVAPEAQAALSLTPLFEMANRVYEPLEVLRQGLALIFAATGADVGFVYVLESGGQYLNLVSRLNGPELPAKAARDLADEAPRRRLGQGISGRVAAAGQPIFLADASVEPRVSTVYVREQPQGVASLPITTPRGIYGVLTLAHLGVKDYTPPLRDYLLNACRLLGWVYESWQSQAALNPTTSPAQVRVLVVEQQPLFRQSLAAFLGKDQRLNIVGELDSSAEALNVCRKRQPDLILLDINLTEPDAVSLIRALKAEFPALKIIVLGVYEEDWRLIESFKAGATGHLLKTALPDEFVAGVQTVWAGRYLLSPRLAERLLKEVVGLESEAAQPSGLHLLSQRELSVLRGLTHGSSTKSLAQELNISPKTLNQHISTIYRKLKVSDRVQLTLFAIQHGLV